MLHILLLILKIIGIILLVILGIVLFAIIDILFAPAYYKVEAETPDGVEKLSASAKAHWFFHLATAYIIYKNKKTKWQVRFFWKVWNSEDKKADDELKEAQQPEVDGLEEERLAEEHFAEESCEEEVETIQEDIPQFEEEDNEEIPRKEKAQAKPKKENLFQKIKYTIQRICDKLKALWEKKEKIEDFLNDENHKIAFEKCKKEILVLAKRIRPRTIKGRIHFGFKDPYNTGRVLAILSVLYPFYGDRIQIEPDFEDEVLEGNIHAKGHIRGIHLLIIVCRFLFDQNIKNTYKDYKALK